jgi:hypothetical protein
MMIRWISAMALLITTARAAPPPGQSFDPEMKEWYSGLRQPQTNIGCCSISDCRPYESRITKDHYEIKVNRRWFAVPNEVVLHRENKAGQPIACLRTQWNQDYAEMPSTYEPDILCFVPGPET